MYTYFICPLHLFKLCKIIILITDIQTKNKTNNNQTLFKEKTNTILHRNTKYNITMIGGIYILKLIKVIQVYRLEHIIFLS